MKVWLKTFAVSLFAFTLFSFGASAQGCTKEQGQQVATVASKEAINATLCVLQNIGLPPEQIVLRCVGTTIGDVQNVLAQTPPEMKARLMKGDAGSP